MLPDGPPNPDYSYSALNGLTRDADGKITYNFDGRVKARGLDLDAGLGGVIESQNRIRWIYGPNGEAIADDSAYEQIGGGFARYISLTDEDPLSSSGATIFMHENGGGLSNGINVTAVNPNGSGPLNTLINAAGQSSYMQLADQVRKVNLHGPWVENISLPAGPSGGNGGAIDVGAALQTGNYVVVGYISGSNTITWGVLDATADTLQFTYGNWYAGAGQAFSFGFFVVSFG